MAEAMGKTKRRSIQTLWESAALYSELDRIMLAMHLFQTQGQVDYRMMVGMHGGGGGRNSEEFTKLMEAKAMADLGAHYDDKFPDDYIWPAAVPNAATPQDYSKSGDDVKSLIYTFCWHAEPAFIVWHRPLTAEFERMLQRYDPKPDADFSQGDRHNGPQALGLPYWGWEKWDGVKLPKAAQDQTYTIRTDAWKQDDGTFGAGTVLANPFHRWFAPVDVAQQVVEYFPTALDDTNCTQRGSNFTDPTATNGFTWDNTPITAPTSMYSQIQKSMATDVYLDFATMKPDVGRPTAVENAHNKFHNYLGGLLKKDGQAEVKVGDVSLEYTGTMAQNQSIFDPIFWLHHSNVERQLCSWQRLHPGSRPPRDVERTVLYPFTKPELLFAEEAAFSWNTGKDKTGTLKEWYDAATDLPYEYEEYLTVDPVHERMAPTVVNSLLSAMSDDQLVQLRSKAPKKIKATMKAAAELADVVITATHTDRRGGEFQLRRRSNGEVLAISAVLSGLACARCATKQTAVSFDVTHQWQSLLDGDWTEQVELLRNGKPVDVTAWRFAKHVASQARLQAALGEDEPGRRPGRGARGTGSGRPPSKLVKSSQ